MVKKEKINDLKITIEDYPFFRKKTTHFKSQSSEQKKTSQKKLVTENLPEKSHVNSRR